MERQNNLRKICSVLRGSLHGAVENSDYGNDSILREYIDDNKITIRGRIQHGWAIASVGKTYYLNDLLPSYLWSTESHEHAISRGWRNVYVIGAPWLYLLENLKSKGFNHVNDASYADCKRSLWVFGSHSNLADEVGCEHIRRFLDLAMQDTRTNNVTVLLSHLDFNTYKFQLGDRYKELNILTLGERRGTSSSEAHLYNLYHLLNKTDVVVIDHPSTLVLYALSLRKKVRWVQNSSFAAAVSILENMEDKKIVSIMKDEITSEDELQSYALEQLGYRNIKPREELLLMFRENNNYWRILKKMISAIIRGK